MKAEEIRKLTASEIEARVVELERERFNLRFRGATEPLSNPLRLRSIRRDIARLQTVLRQLTEAAR
jgi:large subunit ribosomal protein L29